MEPGATRWRPGEQMNLKTATLIALITTGLETLVVLGAVVDRHLVYNIQPLIQLVHLGFYAGLTAFFFGLYSKQKS